MTGMCLQMTSQQVCSIIVYAYRCKRLEQRQEVRLASALIKDVKHGKLAQRLPTQSLKRQMLPFLVVGQTDFGESRSPTPLPIGPRPTTVQCRLRIKHDQKHLIRNKGNTTLLLEHRRLKGVAQAVIKNAVCAQYAMAILGTL